jgi:hypothetical protein
VALDCLWAAASIAVVNASPRFVQSQFSFHGGPSLVDQTYQSTDVVQVQLHDPLTLAPHTYSTTIANRSQVEDDPKGVWFHSAQTQALQLMASDTSTPVPGVGTDGTFLSSSGSASAALGILTGKTSARKSKSEFADVDAFWDAINHLTAGTPMTISTPDEVDLVATQPPFGANHAYALLEIVQDTGGEGKRELKARNPWGATNLWDVQEVWDNLSALSYLEGWVTLDVE